VSGSGATKSFSAWQRYLEALAAHRPTVLRDRGSPLGRSRRCSTSSSTCSTGPRTCRSWSSPPLVPSSTTTRPGGAAAGATRRRSGSRRSSDQGHRSTRLVSPRAVGHARRDAGGSLERRGGIRSTRSSSSGCSAESAPATGRHFRRPCRRSSPRGSTHSSELKSLLQDASVLGKVFWTGSTRCDG
jgi:hypothetical protein